MDRHAVSNLFALYGSRLVLYARQLLPGAGRADAEDVVQELFVRLLAKTEETTGLTEQPNPIAWLHLCVRNACLDEQRSRLRRRRREMDRSQPDAWFDARTDALIDGQTAQAAVEKLDGPLREVLVLRIWSGLTLAETAVIVGRPASTVFDQYQRALSTLRRAIEQKVTHVRFKS